MVYSNKFKTALRHVLKSEGGKVDDPNDAGGRTNQGIIQTRYDEYRVIKKKPTRDVWSMEDNERDEIYHSLYWKPMRCDEMPLPIAYMAFDCSVLHGVNFAPKCLQVGVGVLQDGQIGPVTLAAAKAQDVIRVRDRMREVRWERMKSRPSFKFHKNGWTKRLDDVGKNVTSMLRLAN